MRRRRKRLYHREYKKRNPEKIRAIERKSGAKYRRAHPEIQMVRGAKSRAKQRGLPFNLKPSDIVVPKKCPVLGIPLRISKGALTDHSPSLDKIVPRKGYVRGNVIVVSMRVNRIKSDATIKELRLMADFYEQYAKTTSGRR